MDIDYLVEQMDKLEHETDPDALTAQAALILYEALAALAPRLVIDQNSVLRLLSTFDEVTGA